MYAQFPSSQQSLSPSGGTSKTSSRLLLALVEVKERNCKSNLITRFFVLLCSRNFGRNECIASLLLLMVYIRHEIVKFLHVNTYIILTEKMSMVSVMLS